jgi:glucokinase
VQSLTPEAILSAARDGDELAGEVLADYLRHLAAAVVSYVHAYDPDVVILGGGIMHAADQILPPIQEFVDEHAWTCPQRSIPVRSAALGDGAAMVGAAALARGEARFR